MYLKQLALLLGCLVFSSVFLVNCSSSSNPTGSSATPTPGTSSSTSSKELYALVVESNGGSGQTVVGIKGPYSNSANTAVTFSLPSPTAGTMYAIFGIMDVANSLVVPSGAQSLTPPASDYGQFYPTGCPTGSPNPTTYNTTTSGIDLTMSVANGACTFGTGQTTYYNPLSGSSVILSGAISQTGL